MTHRIVLFIFAGLSFGSLIHAQGSLALSSTSAARGSSVVLDLTLANAGTAPAGVEWTLSFPPSDVASVSTTEGPALIAAGKTVYCNTGTGTVKCLAAGMNNNGIASGVVAKVTVTLNTTGSSLSVPLPLTNPGGAAPDGSALSVSGTGGSVTVPGAVPPPVLTTVSSSDVRAGNDDFRQ